MTKLLKRMAEAAAEKNDKDEKLLVIIRQDHLPKVPAAREVELLCCLSTPKAFSNLLS